MSGMRFLLAFALCAALFTSQVSADQCEGKLDGTFVPDPQNCAIYFLCDGNVGWEYKCPGVLVWNTEKNTCDFPQNVDCDERPIVTPTDKPQTESPTVGTTEGSPIEPTEGSPAGSTEGSPVGSTEGSPVGSTEGSPIEPTEGPAVESTEGATVESTEPAQMPTE